MAASPNNRAAEGRGAKHGLMPPSAVQPRAPGPQSLSENPVSNLLDPSLVQGAIVWDLVAGTRQFCWVVHLRGPLTIGLTGRAVMDTCVTGRVSAELQGTRLVR
jgi:hypothetical protein